MNNDLIYFSPTGGTKKVLDILAKDCLPRQEIDLSVPDADYRGNRFAREDVCWVAVPSFGGRVPAVAVERLLQLQGNGARAVAIVVYGNRAFDDTLLELRDTLTRCGFRTVAAVGAVAEHSIMRQYGAGRPDAADRAELNGFAEKIKAALASTAPQDELQVPGKRPYQEYGGVPLKPSAGKKCTECGACAALCPVGAIPKNSPRQTDNTRCISCMRCITVCPQGARTLNPVILNAAVLGLKKACTTRKENTLYL